MSMTKAEFQEAFRNLITAEFCDVPTDENCIRLVFSERFEKRMDKLVRSTERICWNWVNTAAKRAAVIALIVLALLSSAMSVKAIREPVITFFTEIYEKYIDLSFVGDTSETIEREYALTHIPSGFSLIDKQSTTTSIMTTYKSADGNLLMLDQTITAAIDTSIDNERGTVTNTSVGEIPVLIYEAEDLVLVSWAYDSYYFTLVHYGQIDPNAMLEIVQGVK